MTDRLLEPLRPSDVADVVAVNERHQHLTAPLTAEGLLRLAAVGTVEVARVEGRFAGFVVTMDGDADHDSGNLAWFAARYDRFVYLDRVVVHEDFRRRGLAGRVYDELEARAARRVPLLALEVNTDPPNEPSLAFHAGRGFERAGERTFDGHTVVMLVKRLG